MRGQTVLELHEELCSEHVGRRPYKLFTLVLVAFLAACGSGDGDATPMGGSGGDAGGEPILTGLSVEPSSLSFDRASQTEKLKVFAEFENGLPVDLEGDPELQLSFELSGVASVDLFAEVFPSGDGQTDLVLRYRGVEARVPVSVDICKPIAPLLDATEVTSSDGWVTVSGKAPGASSVEVTTPIATISSTVNDGAFSVSIMLEGEALDRRESWGVTAFRDDCRSATSFLSVMEDRVAPKILVRAPVEGAASSQETIDVIGRVHDAISGVDELSVFVNGEEAVLQGGFGTETTFVAQGISLVNDGDNALEIVAIDGAGNEGLLEVTVLYQTPTRDQIRVVSGNGQSGAVEAFVADPLVVRVLDADNDPIANKLVTFSIARNAGLLASSPLETGRRLYQTRTDASGLAEAYWQLGDSAGLGNQQVEVSGAQLQGLATFWAAGAPLAPARINLSDAMRQLGEPGAQLRHRTRVWVNDGRNGIAGANVLFRVEAGDGLVDGQREVTRVADGAGYADIGITLGPREGINLISATLPSSEAVGALFIEATAVARTEGAPTRFVGRVLNNADEPLGNASIELEFGDVVFETITEEDGSFLLDDLASAGPAHLRVIGTTVNRAGGRAVSQGRYPSLEFEVSVVPTADNSLPNPVYLPELASPVERYSLSRQTILTMEGVDGLEFIIEPGSMTLADGTPARTNQTVSVNRVDPDRIPMPLPDQATGPIAWTVQPAGATFDPPIAVRMPNTAGLAPGTEVAFLSFDHDLAQFEVVASGTISDDGAFAVTDPGSGITKAGWGGICPPYSATGDVRSCSDAETVGWLSKGVELTGNLLGDVVGDAIDCATTFVTGVGNVVGKTERSDCEFWFQSVSSVKGIGVSCAQLLPLARADRVLRELERWSAVGENVSDIVASKCFSDSKTVMAWAKVSSQVFGFANDSAKLLNRLSEGTKGQAALGLACQALSQAERLTCQNPADPGFFDDFAPASDAQLRSNQPDLEQLPSELEFIKADVEELQAAAAPLRENLLEVMGALDHSELAGFEICAGNQCDTVDDSGGFALLNIAAPDSFGPEGPGSPPDQIGDELLRLIGSRGTGEQQEWLASDYFRVQGGGPVTVSDLTILDEPPAETVSIDLSSNNSTPITSEDETRQLTTSALQTDRVARDLTLPAEGTTYRSSNFNIARVSPEGEITPGESGIAYITATNGGVATVIPVSVAIGDPLTQVEGRVVDADGFPVAGVEVRMLESMVTTGEDGRFAFDSVPTTLGDIVVTARVDTQFGTTAPVTPLPDLVTDVGDIFLGLSLFGAQLFATGHCCTDPPSDDNLIGSWAQATIGTNIELPSFAVAGPGLIDGSVDFTEAGFSIRYFGSFSASSGDFNGYLFKFDGGDARVVNAAFGPETTTADGAVGLRVIDGEVLVNLARVRGNASTVVDVILGLAPR